MATKQHPSQKELLELFDYDYKSGVLTRKKCTANRHTKGEVVGFGGSRGYIQATVKSKKYPIHRLIWCWVYGDWPEGDIDHINRNRVDNRISNLRAVSRSENNHNSGTNRRNTSGFKGVSWDRTKKKWMASIGVNGKLKFLGRYDSPESASVAYQQAKATYHPTAPQL